MSVISRVNPEILEHIKEIANKMKNHRAAVMVGAGFSKNAEAILPTDKKFLDWNGLGNVFYRKTHGKNPGSEAQYLNVLKLAEEVEAAYGRTVLNQLIKDSLPDLEYAPSVLHQKLLNLDWKDVFTTNYDTLLERTLEQITDKHYDVILNKEDLIYSAEPRIIKLHGSFPSTFPFVITEEDYRQYPHKSAIFVNTVQQTLIENVLCLIGFSGDDPNFLQWIGWIRDNIGRDLASKIYLVGKFDFSTAQINLLQSRNIIVLNMKNSDGVDSHQSALELFFDALDELTKKEDTQKWPPDKIQHSITFMDDDVTEKVKAVTKEWKESRDNYPGWYILPADNRKNLMLKTEVCEHTFYHINKGKLSSDVAFDFLYEYNWRMNKCLVPIAKSNINIYENILAQANPFIDVFALTENDVKYIKEAVDWHIVCKKWIDIYIDIMRAYRENGYFDKFNVALANLTSISGSLSAEQKAKINCEKVRKLLFELNIRDAKIALSEWPKDISLPAYEMQKAGLFMELGDVAQAYKILLDELNYVRKGPNKEINYFKITIEAYLVLLARYAKQSLDFMRSRVEEETEIKYSGKFDAYAEIRLFEALLKEEAPKEYEKEEYDLNRITRTITSSNTGHKEAFQFIRLFEEIGRPFNCNHVVSSKTACSEAIRRINPFSPIWALILQIKNNDVKKDDKVWSREIISEMTNEEIENYAQLCISSIKNNLEYIENGNSWRESNFQLSIAAIMPEILSRLCSRMSKNTQIKTLELLDMIYRSDKTENFKNIKHLAKRLVSSMSEKTKVDNFGALMKTYLYEPTSEVAKLDFADIFESFSYQERSQDKYKNINLDEHLTDILLQLLDKETGRDVALTRLFHLYNFGLLSTNDIKAFEKNIWSKLDENGLPQIPKIYLKNYILSLPTPENIDSISLLKNYILNLSIPKKQRGVTVGSMYDMPLFFMELQYCTYSVDNPKGIKWNAEEIIAIIRKILETWENDKTILLSYDKSDLGHEEVLDELFEKYKNVDNILAKVLISNGSEIKEKDLIQKLTAEFDSFNIPCIQLRILVNNDDRAFDEIYSDICGTNKDKIYVACNAIYTLMSLKNSEYTDSCLDLLRKVSFNIRVRRKQGLISIINSMHNLIYSDLLPNDITILDNILFGLDYLFEETELSNNDLECSVNQCIGLRAAATNLAYILYEKNKDNPDIYSKLEKWKNLCNDLTEFSEVRNKWCDL